MQLAFPGMGQTRPVAVLVYAEFDGDGDNERDRRSESEWINAVIAYLKFRAGSAWRLGRSCYRSAPRYHEYLDAIRLVEEVRYRGTSRIEPVLPALPHETAQRRLSWIHRPWDHFARCRCSVCRSLRLRGHSPQSVRPAREARRA